MNAPILSGVSVAVVTPFDARGGVDLNALVRHGEWLISRGASALAPMGTSGEFLYLRPTEKAEILRTVLPAWRDRVAVVPCVWDPDPEVMVSLGQAAHELGARAVFYPPPLYHPLGDDAIVAAVSRVATRLPMPVLAYHVPAYAVNGLSREVLARLAAGGIVAGIKDSGGDPGRLQELAREFGATQTVVAGGDHVITAACRAGVHGVVGALANAFPGLTAEAWKGSEAAQGALTELRSVTKQSGGLAAIKHLVTRRGFASGVRYPFLAPSSEQRAALDAAWDRWSADTTA